MGTTGAVLDSEMASTIARISEIPGAVSLPGSSDTVNIISSLSIIIPMAVPMREQTTMKISGMAHRLSAEESGSKNSIYSKKEYVPSVRISDGRSGPILMVRQVFVMRADRDASEIYKCSD